MENSSNKLPDTPWHIGFIKKDEKDPRRHKSKCVYNNGKRCTCAYMVYCQSSSHCVYYAEDWETARRYMESMIIDNRKTNRWDAGTVLINPYKSKKENEQSEIIQKKSSACKKETRKTNKHKRKSKNCITNKNVSKKENQFFKKKSICITCSNLNKENNCCRITNRKMNMEYCNQYR